MKNYILLFLTTFILLHPAISGADDIMNDKFITNLVRAGYQLKPGEPEDIIVDRWFQDVCRNVVQENYEQWEANQPYDARPRVLDKRDLGGGRTEVS